MARPLKTALAPLFLATSVTVEGVLPVAPTVGFQPSIVPFSVSNRNTEAPEWPLPSVIMKADVSALNTCPVGAAPVTVTTSGTLLTEADVLPMYRVALSVPLSATHSGEPGWAFVPGDAASPHAFTRLWSNKLALPCWSDTRLIWR